MISRHTIIHTHWENRDSVNRDYAKNVFTSTEYALCAVMARLEFMLKTNFEFDSIRLRVARCLAHLKVEIYVRPANLHAMRCSSEIWIFRRGLVQWDRRAYVCELRERRSARKPRRRLWTNVLHCTNMLNLRLWYNCYFSIVLHTCNRPLPSDNVLCMSYPRHFSVSSFIHSSIRMLMAAARLKTHRTTESEL